MHLTESHMYAFNRITHVCICIEQNHTCMHLTESHICLFNNMYVFNRITIGMHLTESHMYAFNRITHVCI